KRRSPGAGDINVGVDPAAQASAYEQAGASCVSVLTDAKYFGGSNADLQTVRQAIGLPVLRKDFTVDEYHVWEARSIRAHAVLLSVRALGEWKFVDSQALAHGLDLTVGAEVHDEGEIERAVAAKAAIIGITNRALTTMTVAVNPPTRLRPLVPAGVTLISE